MNSKIICSIVVVAVVCLLIPQTAEAHCPCMQSAERERMRKESDCSLAQGAGIIGCGMMGFGAGAITTPLGGAVVTAICGGVVLGTSYVCEKKARTAYNNSVAACQRIFANCN